MVIDLGPVDRITADAVGQPGQRTFFIQGRKGDHMVTVVVEKQQVQLLAASVVEILARVGKETGEGPGEDAMGLEEPILPEWRAGRLSIGYQEERDLILLEAEEVEPEEDAEDSEERAGEEPGTLPGVELRIAVEPEGGSSLPGEEPGEAAESPTDTAEGPQPGRVRFWATREQMLSLARHAAAVCAAGRPRCNLCGNPMDPEGHECPALNGHRKTGL